MSNRFNTLQIKTVLIIILSIMLIFTDIKFNVFLKVKNYRNATIGTIYFFANDFIKILENIFFFFKEHKKLILENDVLRTNLLLKDSDLLLMEMYKKENTQLHKLLSSPLCQTKTYKMITKVIATSTNPHKDQIIIDKGTNNNVYVGQPVINDKGVVGQVIATNKLTSKVILICDKSHALPIQIIRNNIRLIAKGNGCHKDLQLEYSPGYIDVKVGDLLVTSGLGGNFPKGYPVAKISAVTIDKNYMCMKIQAKPMTKLQYLNNLLLIWDNENNDK